MDSIANLKIIEEMMYTAKKEVKDNGVYFMLWGWLVFAAAMGQAILTWLKMDNNVWTVFTGLNVQLDGITWLILMPLGAIISMLVSRKQQKEEKVRTWFDDVMKYLWIAFGAVLGITLFMMNYTNVNLFPIVIAIYGLGLFITGGVLKFKPLVFGGVASWVLAVAAILVSGVYVTLILALAVFIGYIIPGHLLQKQWKSNV
jgi:hypothetical protein